MEKTSWSSKEARKLYMEKWRKNNKEKIKKHQETFWAKKAKEMEEQGCQK